MLDLVLKDSINSKKVSHLISDPHPQAVVLWHLASSLAYRAGQGKMAEELFMYALDALTDRGELFWTIKMAVCAEMIALGLEGRLKTSPEIWKKYGEQYIEKTYKTYAGRVQHNPFLSEIKDIHIDLPICYFRIADCVVY